MQRRWAAAGAWWAASLGLHRPLQIVYGAGVGRVHALEWVGRGICAIAVVAGGAALLLRIRRGRGGLGVLGALIALAGLAVSITSGPTAGEALHAAEYGLLTWLLGGDLRAVLLAFAAGTLDELGEVALGAWGGHAPPLDGGDILRDAAGAVLVGLATGGARV